MLILLRIRYGLIVKEKCLANGGVKSTADAANTSLLLVVALERLHRLVTWLWLVGEEVASHLPELPPALRTHY